MANNHHPVEVDPQALAHSRQLWTNFWFLTKIGIAAVAVLLIGMALFLL